MYKKGTQVKVVKDCHSASRFNEGGLYPAGIYKYPDWREKVFTIEGTIKQYKNYLGDIVLCYLLQHKGKDVGYVYENALEEYKEPINLFEGVFKGVEYASVKYDVFFVKNSHSMEILMVDDKDREMLMGFGTKQEAEEYLRENQQIKLHYNR